MYAIGQKFEGTYPPEAAVWCNENGAMIVQVAGGFEITPAPTPTTDDLFSTLRAARDAKLRDTDKYLLPDYPIAADTLEQVKAYRAALRDLPDQPGAPWDGVVEETPWPEKPNF